jgi:hypothetical protein
MMTRCYGRAQFNSVSSTLSSTHQKTDKKQTQERARVKDTLTSLCHTIVDHEHADSGVSCFTSHIGTGIIVGNRS